MPAYEDQEQAERLIAWWKAYGKSLIAGVAIGAALLFGYRYWHQREEALRVEASQLYEQMLVLQQQKQPETATVADKLMQEYAGTPYAGAAALALARLHYESGDVKAAQGDLSWAVSHTGGAVQHAARLRLARLRLEAGEREAAAALLNVGDTAGFEAEYLELRGDILVAQGRPGEARAAYRDALGRLAERSPYAGMLAMKLDDLGPEKTP